MLRRIHADSIAFKVMRFCKIRGKYFDRRVCVLNSSYNYCIHFDHVAATKSCFRLSLVKMNEIDVI